MATKERSQNAVINDTLNLRMFTYNSNNLTDLSSIDKVEIYYLDRFNITADNPDGRRLVDSFDGSGVVAEDTGSYLLQVPLQEKKYVIGTHLDLWHVIASDDKPAGTLTGYFQIYPDLWYSSPLPIVYDFSFRFQPNKFRKGSKQFIIIEISPNVPTAGDLREYYENLAIVSDLSVSIEQSCGDCLPAECDLRLLVDNEKIQYREKRYGFYQLDTTDMDCGLFDIWFTLDFGGNRYVSDREKFQIYN
jgi:hypothetical protein